VHGDQEPGADELVELDVAHGPAAAALGGVQDQEDMVRVGVDLGHLVALDAVAHGQGMEAEHLGEHPDALLVAGRDVDPHEPLPEGDQQLQLLGGPLLDPAVGDQPDLHDLATSPRRRSVTQE
jgi:hypothetical protein